MFKTFKTKDTAVEFIHAMDFCKSVKDKLTRSIDEHGIAKHENIKGKYWFVVDRYDILG